MGCAGAAGAEDTATEAVIGEICTPAADVAAWGADVGAGEVAGATSALLPLCWSREIIASLSALLNDFHAVCVRGSSPRASMEENNANRPSTGADITAMYERAILVQMRFKGTRSMAFFPHNNFLTKTATAS